MLSSRRADCVHNARMIRLNAELGSRLEELGIQTRAMVRDLKAGLRPDPTDAEGIDHVPAADC